MGDIKINFTVWKKRPPLFFPGYAVFIDRSAIKQGQNTPRFCAKKTFAMRLFI